MATVYSSTFDGDFRAFMTYTTETTSTAYKVKVTNAGVQIDCSWANYPWKTTITATSYDSRSDSVGTTYWTEGAHGVLTADKTYSWTRKTSSYSVTIKVTTKKNVSGGGSGSKSVTFTVPALAKYTITYDANGGSGAPSETTKYHGESATLSTTTPTRSGYTFMGWGTAATDSTVEYAAGASYTANASITLYAAWKKTITLTYNANGGSGAPESQSATVYNATTSATFTITTAKPTRSGYEFQGWGIATTDSTVDYASGSNITLSTNTTLYAIWKKTITLTYNANGGSGAPESQSATVYNATTSYNFTLGRAPTTSKSGYTFVGWGTSSSATSGTAAGGTITLSTNTTLYAIWKKTITLTYNVNGGSGTFTSQSATVYNATTSKTFSLPTTTPTRNNYVFLGWSTSSSATSASYSVGGSVTLSSTTTLYAVWKLNYIAPTVKVSAKRVDNSGNDDDEGIRGRVTVVWTAGTLGGVAQASTITVQRSVSGANSWTTVHTSNVTTASGTTTTTIFELPATSTTASTETQYDIKVTVSDSNGSNSATTFISKSHYVIDIDAEGTGVSFGSGCSRKGLSSSWDVYLDRGKYIYSKLANGEDHRLVGISGSADEDIHFCYTSYEKSVGNVYYSGNKVYIRSRAGVYINSPINIYANGEYHGVWGLGYTSSDTNKTYPGLIKPDGASTGYVRTPESGIIPYQSGGHGTVGTSGWRFNNGYFVNADASGTLNVGGAATFNSTLKVSGVSTQGRINASNIYLSGSQYTGGKTSTTDGHNGVALGSSGSIYLQGSNPTVVFTQAGTTTVGARIFIQTPSDGFNYLKFKADNKYLVFRQAPSSDKNATAYLYGEEDGKTTLGATSFRFYRLYAANSSISTSDKRQKKNIKALKEIKKKYKKSNGNVEEVDLYGELFNRLEPTEYDFIEGGNRKNFGLIAQDVLESMTELGIGEDELDLVHHDTWTDENTGEEKDAYGIAYENLIPLLIYEVQKLKGVNNER